MKVCVEYIMIPSAKLLWTSFSASKISRKWAHLSSFDVSQTIDTQ